MLLLILSNIISTTGHVSIIGAINRPPRIASNLCYASSVNKDGQDRNKVTEQMTTNMLSSPPCSAVACSHTPRCECHSGASELTRRTKRRHLLGAACIVFCRFCLACGASRSMFRRQLSFFFTSVTRVHRYILGQKHWCPGAVRD